MRSLCKSCWLDSSILRLRGSSDGVKRLLVVRPPGLASSCGILKVELLQQVEASPDPGVGQRDARPRTKSNVNINNMQLVVNIWIEAQMQLFRLR